MLSQLLDLLVGCCSVEDDSLTILFYKKFIKYNRLKYYMFFCFICALTDALFPGIRQCVTRDELTQSLARVCCMSASTVLLH